MRKPTSNQVANLVVLWTLTRDSGAAWFSAAAWRKACPPGMTVSTAGMVKTGLVEMSRAVVSRNGKVIELYKLAAPTERRRRRRAADGE